MLYFTAIFLLPIGNLFVTCAVCFFAGMLNVPILPSTYAFATKIDSSVPQQVVNGLMMSGAQLFSFFESLLASYLLSFGQV